MTTELAAIETGARFRVLLQAELATLRAWLRTPGLPFELRQHMELREGAIDLVLAESGAARVGDVCQHPLARARFDGPWDPDVFPGKGCATCGVCGTSMNVELRPDYAERVHGGPRALSMVHDTPTVTPPVIPDSARNGTGSDQVRAVV